MLTPRNSGLATQDSAFTTLAIDVLFHPTSHTGAGDCPLHPPSEAELDAAGIARALVSQCKKWSCDHQWMCVDTRLDDVIRYTESSPRFVGLAGYNPFDIAESLREMELAVASHGFRGAYVHAASFNLPLTDARMYPVFAKAAELGVPVLAQLPPAAGMVRDLERVVSDFPELAVVLAQSRPQLADITAISARCQNVYFALDPGALLLLIQQWTTLAISPDREVPGHPDFLSDIFEQRCMWGSNGQDWREAVRVADPFPLLSEARACFLHRNAESVFALDHPPASRTPRSMVMEILAAER